MAIKVSGTTVIDDSRQLTNIASVDATTVAALSSAGVGGGGGLVSLTSDGAIDARDPVILTGTGEAASVGLVLSGVQDNELLTTSTNNVAYLYDSNNDKYILITHDGSNTLNYRIGTPSGNSITWTSDATLNSSSGNDFAANYNPVDQKIVVVHDETTGNGPWIRTYTLSGTTLTETGSVNGNHTGVYSIRTDYHAYSQTIAVAYNAGSNSVRLGAVNSSSATPTFDSTPLNSSHTIQLYGFCCRQSTDQVFLQWREAVTTGSSFISRMSINSSGFAGGVTYTYTVGNYQKIGRGMNIAGDKLLAAYTDSASSNAFFWLRWDVQTGTINNNQSSSIIGSNGNPLILTEPIADEMRIFYLDSGALKGYDVDLTSGVSEGTVTTFVASGVTDLPHEYELAGFSRNDRQLFTYRTSTTTRGRRVEANATNLTSTNLLGISNETQADGQTTEIAIIGSVVDGFTGLTIGTNYYVQEDGTITTSTGGQLIGKAISATQLLITQV